MKKKDGRRRSFDVACLSGVLALAGCATPPDEATQARIAVSASRDMREVSMQRAWIGRTHDDLVRAFGAPSFMLEVPGGRLPESYIVVFIGSDRGLGRCIDAFVVLKDETATIWNYFCR
jgi:hypothetical protein